MGWWLGLAPATLEFWVRFPNERNQGKQAHPVLKYRVPHGSHPKREEPGKTGAPCVKVPGSSRVPAPPWVGSRSPDGWDQIPRWAGGWVLHQPPWREFWVRFPNERNQGKQAHPVLKYRVPQGFQCVMSRLIHTGLGSSSLIAHVLHSPPPPTRTAL
jgi:hypothetical protein